MPNHETDPSKLLKALYQRLKTAEKLHDILESSEEIREQFLNKPIFNQSDPTVRSEFHAPEMAVKNIQGKIETIIKWLTSPDTQALDETRGVWEYREEAFNLQSDYPDPYAPYSDKHPRVVMCLYEEWKYQGFLGDTVFEVFADYTFQLNFSFIEKQGEEEKVVGRYASGKSPFPEMRDNEAEIINDILSRFITRKHLPTSQPPYQQQ